MMKISYKNAKIRGVVPLPSSKSIANRALLIRALCDTDFPISPLSTAQDTQTLLTLLHSDEEVLDAGPAGTTFRFLTAYLAFKGRRRVLTGSERMLQRPIGVLVDALQHLGADIRYLGKEGFPPLEIHPPASFPERGEVEVAADISSQYISALLMVAPTLPQGLRIRFKGRPVSMPYIQMTLRMMAYFGAEYQADNAGVQVFPKAYSPRPFEVEADWSAVSYYLSIAALAGEADIHVDGLREDSLQGDRRVVDMMAALGVRVDFTERGIRIRKAAMALPERVEWDFTKCPDIAQTMAVTCAGLGVEGRFSGLQTLRIKETDRIAALRTELAKVGVEVSPWKTADTEGITIRGKAVVDNPVFDTYHDHRMAMAFAPLALLGQVGIRDPKVVGKSYPDFWRDFGSLVEAD